MGIRCGCRGTATGSFGTELLVDGQTSNGNMITNINICPICNPNSSSILIEYTSVDGSNVNFTFNSTLGEVGFPECEGGNSLNVEAQGTLTGNIRDDFYLTPTSATLQLSLDDSTNEMCITLLVDEHIITGCRIGGPIIEVDNC
ncbi:hypothetical protein [Bacillus sp. EB01]|uniref:hypothetical protein n=1 Tax=Bacillus sp. EB01 TaxID=1347086 RepID=UPI0005C46D54|nr:hypothetical protein [Bacillus sp. EB01]